MADLHGTAQTADVAITGAAAAKTVVQILAPANHRVKVKGWGVFFDGVATTNPACEVRLLRQSSAGTMSALTPVKTRPAAESLLVTAQHTATVEPTAGDVVDALQVHPQSGFEVQYAPGDEVVVGGGERLGIEVYASANVNVRAKIRFEE